MDKFEHFDEVNEFVCEYVAKTISGRLVVYLKNSNLKGLYFYENDSFEGEKGNGRNPNLIFWDRYGNSVHQYAENSKIKYKRKKK